MAGFSHNFLKLVKEPDFMEVGRNKTPLTKLFLVEDHTRKNGAGEWEVVGKTFWGANVWKEKAVEASFLKQGDVIDVSAEVRNGKKGEYVHFKAFTSDDSYTTKDGEEVSKTILTINDWEKREFKNND